MAKKEQFNQVLSRLSDVQTLDVRMALKDMWDLPRKQSAKAKDWLVSETLRLAIYDVQSMDSLEQMVEHWKQIPGLTAEAVVNDIQKTIKQHTKRGS